MVENVTPDMSALMYTVHGVKRPQGELAIVNQKTALVYIEGKGKDKKPVGYTYLDEMMMKACTSSLPVYKLDF